MNTKDDQSTKDNRKAGGIAGTTATVWTLLSRALCVTRLLNGLLSLGSWIVRFFRWRKEREADHDDRRDRQEERREDREERRRRRRDQWNS